MSIDLDPGDCLHHNYAMKIRRRSFIIGTAFSGIMTLRSESPSATKAARPLVIATWPFARPASEKAFEILVNGGPGLDAVEQGIGVVESGNNDRSVGLGGIPNAAGVVQLDACIMSGPGHRAGSVAALEGFAHPISVARRVMEKTSHVMLVGEGARLFALEQGFESVSHDAPTKHEEWFQRRAARKRVAAEKGHDTITMLALAADGSIHGGCSTSGRAGKLPGRVGDSPIIGAGLYVDNEVGAAGATGMGENVMRYCGSFMVVEYMRAGASPAEACMKTVQRIAESEPDPGKLEINFIALDKQGRFGAAGSGRGFKYCVTTESLKTQVLSAQSLTSVPIAPGAGNRPK
jgi:N4-(beta-N-acetylglucosaminyl)-L-asparaginase